MHVFIYHKITLHVSGIHRTHHQEYIKLEQPSSNVAKFGHFGERLLLRFYDLYQRLQLQFYVLLMMGAMDTRNM
jgi:hypothetical protein